jgi:oligopeptide transport system substrate-binding protein
LTGCAPAKKPLSQVQILRIGIPGEPETFDPQHVFGNSANSIVCNLFEGLVIQHSSEDDAVLPGVAKKWNVSTDELVWTFHLRENATWSNGDAVVAEDFVFSFWRLLHPENVARFADMFYCIKNARLFNLSELRDFNEVGIHALDDHTLVIELEHPAPYLLVSLTNFYALPVHRKSIEAHGSLTGFMNKWATQKNIVSNGAFIFSEHIPYQHITLKKNPNYWDAGTVQLEAVKFFPFEDHNAEERAFRAGQIHLCSRVPQNKIETYLKEAPGLLHMDNYLSTYLYRVNTTQKPFDDMRVRQALSLAIDRELIVSKITQSSEKVSTAYIPNVFRNYACSKHLEFNPEKARALLAEAGYPNGKGFPLTEILYNTSINHRSIAEAIQQMWQTNLGIPCSLHNEEWRVYLNSLDEKRYTIARAQWIGSYVDVAVMLDPWRSGSLHNKTGWQNPVYDRLLDQANNTLDPHERNAFLAEAESILLLEMPIIPVFWNRRIYLLDPAVQGWYPKLTDSRPYKFLSLKN